MTTTTASIDAPVRRAWRRALPVAVAALAVGATAAGCKVTPPPPPAGTDVVVFDIDGTLTASELDSSPQASAREAVQAYVDNGYSVVYVTARWQPLQEGSTRSWLEDNGFPALPLHMSPNLLLDDQSKEDYKTATLAQIEQGAPEVVYAYGDSVSDFAAYANAGVPPSQVYAVRRVGSSSCQPGTWGTCLVGYTDHLAFIESLPPGD